MPGRYETPTHASPQTLNGAACKATLAVAEPVCPRRHPIALLAILVSASVLMLTPAVVAAVSMIDPSALDQTVSWFQPLSPITSHLDHARLMLAAGSVVTVWGGRQGNNFDGAGT
jgi:hypothetical protein